MDRIVLLGSAHHIVIEDLRNIYAESTFLYDKEHQLQNILSESFAEMAFVVNSFKTSHEHILAHGTPELQTYIDQLNEAKAHPLPTFIIELHAYDLSTYFKSFLLLAKATLDKLVPLYSYRFYDSLKQFSEKGTRLIKCINRNKNLKNKGDFVELIEKSKSIWIDALVGLRDQYAHYSNLREYTSFWLPGQWIGERKFVGISDFYRPAVTLNGKTIDALEYMLGIKENMVNFLREFLRLCDFTGDRRPKTYLQCDGCGHVFAKRVKVGTKKGKISLTPPYIQIMIKNHSLDYGVIICPKCGVTTDTDLQFWRREGFSSFSA